MEILIIVIAVLAAMSFVAFVTYFSDKTRAKKGKWRIRESVLLGLGFIGGAAGALIAMNLFRHKTKHWYFWVVNIFSLLLHIAALIVIYIQCV